MPEQTKLMQTRVPVVAWEKAVAEAKDEGIAPAQWLRRLVLRQTAGDDLVRGTFCNVEDLRYVDFDDKPECSVREAKFVVRITSHQSQVIQGEMLRPDLSPYPMKSLTWSNVYNAVALEGSNDAWSIRTSVYSRAKERLLVTLCVR